MRVYDLKYVVNCLFKDRHLYKDIPNDYKEKFFFIINRYLSKMFPEKANILNKQNIDKSLALDIWFIKLRHEDRIKCLETFWIYNKVEEKTNDIFNSKDTNLLIEKLKIRLEDLEYLMRDDVNIKILKEELKYYKSLQK